MNQMSYLTGANIMINRACLAAQRPAPTSLGWAEQRNIQEETTFDDTTNAHIYFQTIQAGGLNKVIGGHPKMSVF